MKPKLIAFILSVLSCCVCAQVHPVGVLLRIDGKMELITAFSLYKQHTRDSIYIIHFQGQKDTLKASVEDFELEYMRVNRLVPYKKMIASPVEFYGGNDPAGRSDNGEDEGRKTDIDPPMHFSEAPMPPKKDMTDLQDELDIHGTLPDSIRQNLRQRLRAALPTQDSWNRLEQLLSNKNRITSGRRKETDGADYFVRKLVFYSYDKKRLQSVLCYSSDWSTVELDTMIYTNNLLSCYHRITAVDGEKMDISYNKQNKVAAIHLLRYDVPAPGNERGMDLVSGYTFTYDRDGYMKSVTCIYEKRKDIFFVKRLPKRK